ncbi:hypothetical protein chiPu_0020941 [Chiloscyllium punctatum]|uniref:Uncharacterized protein n=1 Tax=Chiloscyllium punctatum TaxID=137246 RepID=A0A401RLJ3_CHIPU|nr:hypothetical protein [Chiloscyllium punctatum]
MPSTHRLISGVRTLLGVELLPNTRPQQTKGPKEKEGVSMGNLFSKSKSTPVTTTRTPTTQFTTTVTATMTLATDAAQPVNVYHVLGGVALFVLMVLFLIAVLLYFIKRKKENAVKSTHGTGTTERSEDSESFDSHFVYASIAKPPGHVPNHSHLETPARNAEKAPEVFYSTVEFKSENQPTSIQTHTEESQYASIVLKAK